MDVEIWPDREAALLLTDGGGFLGVQWAGIQDGWSSYEWTLASLTNYTTGLAKQSLACGEAPRRAAADRVIKAGSFSRHRCHPIQHKTQPGSPRGCR